MSFLENICKTYHTCCTIYSGSNRYIINVNDWRWIQYNWTINSCIVKEIKAVSLLYSTTKTKWTILIQFITLDLKRVTLSNSLTVVISCSSPGIPCSLTGNFAPYMHMILSRLYVFHFYLFVLTRIMFAQHLEVLLNRLDYYLLLQ